MTIGKRIKSIRERLGMSQVDFADKINVSKQTLYKYENDIITNIPSDKIENIASLGDISPAYIMGWDEDYYLGENLQNIFEILSKEFSIPTNELIRCFFTENFTDLLPSKKYITLDNMRNALKTYFTFYADHNDILTQDEYEHIEKYRTLDSRGKDIVNTVLNREAERMVELKNKPTSKAPSMRVISYYQRMASAGSGEYLFDDIPTNLIEVEDTPISRKADFVLGVNGHSMEPTYNDGDKVLVRKASEIPIGSIGVFIRDGECYIKELGKDRLISHNKDKEIYPDILTDDRRIDLVGEVLGKI